MKNEEELLIKLNNVMMSGYVTLVKVDNITDKEINEVLNILILSADTVPGEMLTDILLHISSPMIPLSFAILLARCDNEFFDGNKTIINNVFDSLDPQRLLRMIEFLKSKCFGRGFGSKYQKNIKYIMEQWSKETLMEVINIQPNSLYDLINIIHPKYSGERGEIIRDFLKTIRELL